MSAEDTPQPSGRGRRWQFVLPLTLALACTAVLSVHAAQQDRPPQERLLGAVGWISADKVDWWLAGLLVVFLMASWGFYWVPRRREQTALILISTVVMALITVSLGLASYVPAVTNETPWLAPVVWTVSLFLGEANMPFGETSPPVAFELARLFGIGATATGLFAAALDTWVAQWHRISTRWSSDVDVVVGLTSDTLPLIAALMQEADSWTRWEWWHRRVQSPADLQALLRRRPVVSVVTANRSNPHLAAARALGARVVIGDLSSQESARRLLLTPLRRVSVRRLYILTRSQSTNEAVLRSTEAALHEAVRPHRQGIVPRLVVRLDDSRTARSWRINTLNGAESHSTHPESRVTWFRDAVSTDELLAHALAAHAIKECVTHVIVLGSAPLGLALTDRLAWERWARFDLMCNAGAGAGWKEKDRSAAIAAIEKEWGEFLCPTPLSPGAVDRSLQGQRRPLSLRSIEYIDPHADELLDEWERTRPPYGEFGGSDPEALSATWRLPPLKVTASEHVNLQAHVDKLSAAGETVMVIATSTTPRVLDRVRSLAHTRPEVHVVIPDANTSGVAEPSTTDSCAKYGATWLTFGGPLEDSWTALARHNHAAYQQRSEVDRSEPFDPQRVSRLPWDADPAGRQLPEFFREDNLRQMRGLLASVARTHHWIYRPAAAGEAPDLSKEHFGQVVKDEKQRWCELRWERGWTPTKDDRARAQDRTLTEEQREKIRGLRDDARRANPLLADPIDEYDKILARALLGGLRAQGLAPVPHGTQSATSESATESP